MQRRFEPCGHGAYHGYKGVSGAGITHHGNTKKLVQAIAKKYEVTLIDAEVIHQADLTKFDLIGFVSGIDFGKFYPSVEEFLRNHLPEQKHIFFCIPAPEPATALRNRSGMKPGKRMQLGQGSLATEVLIPRPLETDWRNESGTS